MVIWGNGYFWTQDVITNEKKIHQSKIDNSNLPQISSYKMSDHTRKVGRANTGEFYFGQMKTTITRCRTSFRSNIKTNASNSAITCDCQPASLTLWRRQIKWNPCLFYFFLQLQKSVLGNVPNVCVFRVILFSSMVSLDCFPPPEDELKFYRFLCNVALPCGCLLGSRARWFTAPEFKSRPANWEGKTVKTSTVNKKQLKYCVSCRRSDETRRNTTHR